MNTFHPNDITLPKAIVIGPIHEDKRQNAEIHEVLPVNACHALGDDQLQAKKSRGQCGMLTTRTLPVIAPPNDGMPALSADRHGAIVVGRIDDVIREFCDLRDVAAEGKSARACGRNRVG